MSGTVLVTCDEVLNPTGSRNYGPSQGEVVLEADTADASVLVLLVLLH